MAILPAYWCAEATKTSVALGCIWDACIDIPRRRAAPRTCPRRRGRVTSRHAPEFAFFEGPFGCHVSFRSG
jgi:hypothetical protein